MPQFTPLSLENTQEAARVHALAMAAGFGGEAWTAETFATLLRTPGTFGWVADRAGLLMLRHAGDEAEVFTIAVAPAARRRGLARALLETGYIALTALGVQRLLLEVAVDNLPAIALYRAEGFETAGRRPGYYRRGAGSVDALTMARPL